MFQVAFARYGDYSRRQRRLMNQALGPGPIRTYQPLIEEETNTLLRRILADPTDYLAHIRRYVFRQHVIPRSSSLRWFRLRYAGGLTLNAVYGYHPKAKDDEFLKLANESVDILSNEIASGGGVWPVDVLPLRKPMSCSRLSLRMDLPPR